MAFTSQFHMPGAYTFAETTTSSLNAGLFRPPISPSGSTHNLSKSSGSLISDASMANATPAPRLGRKRTLDESTPTNPNNYANMNVDRACDSLIEEDNTSCQGRYVLAGQIETPGAQTAHAEGTLEESMYSDVNYRRALGSKRPHDELELSSSRLQFNTNLGTSGGTAFQQPTPRSSGWTTFAFQAIGGVVGKVWEFCRGGAFKGFSAGGGRGYDTDGQPMSTPSSNRVADPQRSTNPDPAPESKFNPPGTFPRTDSMPYIPNYFDNLASPSPAPAPAPAPVPEAEAEAEPETVPQRPAVKRRQTGANYENDELHRNWVMVHDEAEPSPLRRPTLGSKRSSTASTNTACITPSRSPATQASRLQQPRYHMPLSAAASERRISVPTPRLSNDPQRLSRLQTASTYSLAGHAGSPTLSVREPASFASPRSSPHQVYATPPAQSYDTCDSGFGLSRIPHPVGVGPNPFASIRNASPRPQSRPSSRPSSRQSNLHTPSHSHLGFNASLSKSTGSAHRRNVSSMATAANTNIGRPRNSKNGIDLDDIEASPRLTAEAKELATRKLAAEKRNGARIDTLNARLQDMIRQGQEALGTKYEINMEDSWDED